MACITYILDVDEDAKTGLPELIMRQVHGLARYPPSFQARYDRSGLPRRHLLPSFNVDRLLRWLGSMADVAELRRLAGDSKFPPGRTQAD